MPVDYHGPRKVSIWDFSEELVVVMVVKCCLKQAQNNSQEQSKDFPASKVAALLLIKIPLLSCDVRDYSTMNCGSLW